MISLNQTPSHSYHLSLEQRAFILSLYKQGCTYKDITRRFSEEYKRNRDDSTISD